MSSSAFAPGPRGRDAASTACAARARPRGDRGCDAARAAARARHRPSVPRPAPPPRGATASTRRAVRQVRRAGGTGQRLEHAGVLPPRRGPWRRRPAARARARRRRGRRRRDRRVRRVRRVRERVGAGGKGFGGGGNGGGGGGGMAARSRGAPPKRRRRRLRRRGCVATVEEVVLLDVRGMHCGGCTANVKRILEMERACVSASVNLANESALVRVAVDVQEHTKYPYAGKGAEGDERRRRRLRKRHRARRARGGRRSGGRRHGKDFPTTVREACGVAVAGRERVGRGGEQARGAPASASRNPPSASSSPGRSPRRASSATPRTCSTTPCPGLRCCAARPCTPA